VDHVREMSYLMFALFLPQKKRKKRRHSSPSPELAREGSPLPRQLEDSGERKKGKKHHHKHKHGKKHKKHRKRRKKSEVGDVRK